MSFNWPIITEKLYGIIKGSSNALKMYDKVGNETIDPKNATRFFASFPSKDPGLDSFTCLIALHDEGQTSFINLKTPELTNEADFDKTYQLRNHIHKAISQKEGIKINWQIFDHAIDPREEAVHNIKESKDVSKWFGTTKSSFQKIGEAKLIIRHTNTVNEEKHGARTRHIKALFIENAIGERFSFPHLHMTGARAFARHISNGGNNHDVIGESIVTLSRDYMAMRRVVHEMRQQQANEAWVSVLREAMLDISRRLKSVHGPKGYARAESILAPAPAIIDGHIINEWHAKLAETCQCGGDDPRYDDYGIAARYMPATGDIMPPRSWKWSRKPNLTGVSMPNVLERLGYQVRELAGSCAEPLLAERLANIASKIETAVPLSETEIAFIREAFVSGNDFVEENQDLLPEEKELDEWLDTYAVENVFADTDSTTEPEVADVDEGLGSLIGGMAGAAAGDMVAGPVGGAAGAELGSDAGSYFDDNSTSEADELEEGPADNFTIDDIKHLEKMRDLGQMKDFAKKLIATPSTKPMKPQKVMWLSQAIDSKRRPEDIIKLMYDLLLGGEGLSVVGSKTSMDPNSYRRTFGEEVEDESLMESDFLSRIRQLSGMK
jgi:hypothetical protein